MAGRREDSGGGSVIGGMWEICLVEERTCISVRWNVGEVGKNMLVGMGGRMMC